MARSLLTNGCTRFLSLTVPAVLLLVLTPDASAGFMITVNPSTTPAGSGLTEYDYAITNEPTSSLGFIQFQLAVAAGADPQSITGPAGWDIFYDNLFNVISWTSLEASTDILPGITGTFSFVSPLLPGTQEYSAAGLNNDTSDFEIVYGETISPTFSQAVPEPSSLVLLSSGLVTCGIVARLRRRRTP